MVTRDERWARDRLRAIVPHTTVRNLIRAEGQFNTVVLVNDTWVFRFPKSPAAADHLAREARLLRALAGRLPLPIPRPVYVDESTDLEQAYMGYRMLPGVPVAREAVAALQEGPLRDLADRLSEFMLALHDTPPALLGADEAPQDQRADWASLYEGVREQLYGYMRPEARDRVTQMFTEFLDAPTTFVWRPVVRHGDLGGANLLWDLASHRLTGAIDFASCGMGDPATDLAAVSTLGERLRDLVIERYGFDAGAVRRAAFYRDTFALQEAYFGLRDGDAASVESGLADFR